ncbi:hypothetical protein PR202_gb13499 [Eleusine coracana subsp. coracana]|uniref:Uncharacterized protein n=1 Tax=Eleusine coracana subsp. coracana TaxID=191504 RepID=A0AAV5EQN0_ELECO|nr:hypothetical protein PR202_gb13499 [Eleusine coracana subsp. coracana]
MGIKLEARKTATANFTGVMNMEMVQGLLCAKLAVQPLNLGNASACLLINMAALELYSETALLKDAGELPVSSYLCVLGLMMSQAEDVRKLRHKGIVQGLFGDQHILEFFKDLCPNLVAGQAYWQIFRDIEVYRKKRRLWLAIYKFVYKNAKTIAAVLSIVGVLVGIFKAILSLKSHHE